MWCRGGTETLILCRWWLKPRLFRSICSTAMIDSNLTLNIFRRNQFRNKTLKNKLRYQHETANIFLREAGSRERSENIRRSEKERHRGLIGARGNEKKSRSPSGERSIDSARYRGLRKYGYSGN